MTPLASTPVNRVSEIVESSNTHADKTLHQVIDEMMLPLTDLPSNPVNEELDSLPKTSDTTNMLLYSIIAILSLLGLDMIRKNKR